jgi:hypothetical protein
LVALALENAPHQLQDSGSSSVIKIVFMAFVCS